NTSIRRARWLVNSTWCKSTGCWHGRGSWTMSLNQIHFPMIWRKCCLQYRTDKGHSTHSTGLADRGPLQHSTRHAVAPLVNDEAKLRLTHSGGPDLVR